MRIALAFAVVGLGVVLALWVLGIVGAADAFDGAARTVGVVAIGGGGAFALLALLRGGRPQGPTDGTADGPRF